MTNDVFRTLASHQLHLMIKKGKLQEECKAEWYRRWKLEYPYIRSATGIKKHGG